MSRLGEIKARLAAATPGPWAVERGEEWRDDYPRDTSIQAKWPQPRNGCYGYQVARMSGVNEHTTPDATFIAAAPEDVAYLVSLVERFAGWPSGIRHRIECRVYEGETPLDARCSCGLSDLLREAGP